MAKRTPKNSAPDPDRGVSIFINVSPQTSQVQAIARDPISTPNELPIPQDTKTEAASAKPATTSQETIDPRDHNTGIAPSSTELKDSVHPQSTEASPSIPPESTTNTDQQTLYPFIYKDAKKQKIEDIEIQSDLANVPLSKIHFSRIYGKDLTFHNVDFKYSIFDDCYLRNCKFIGCDFTGATFKSSNLRGTHFSGCAFRYSSWEKTIVDEDILRDCLPPEENIANDLVRSLRVNFAQIGNYTAVNKAASIEVTLTRIHYYKAAYSGETYYRNKYSGLNRFSVILQHCKLKFLDALWGNGESIYKILISILVVLSTATLIQHVITPSITISEVAGSIVSVFWGISTSHKVDWIIVLSLVILRLFFFGLFMAVVVKRLARR
ncbi:MAG: pentapeptide repeat-containing protein [Gemmatales bacterium]